MAELDPTRETDVEPAEGAGAESPAARVSEDIFCIQCGYDLIGLRRAGVCPECGKPVEESMQGNLLVHRSYAYVRRLKRGLSFILNGILLWFILVITGPFLIGLLLPLLGGAGGFGVGGGLLGFQAGLALLDLAVSGLILCGWWLFTTRDPGDPVRDGVPTARKVVRAAVIAQVAFKLVEFGLTVALFAVPSVMPTVAPAGGQGGPPQPAISNAFLLISTLSGLVSLGALAAFATQFFAAMLYVRGLSPRLPDPRVHRLAKTRMIACPIWATVGLLIIVGPLIALVLYWNLLNMVRKNIKRIINQQEAATGAA